MKEIAFKLIDNKWVYVDYEDKDILYLRNWSFNRSHLINNNDYLHRVITRCPKNLTVDHINHNTFDNRKSNLRICTLKDNCRNRRKLTHGTSKYKGVSYRKPGKKTHRKRWRARITLQRNRGGTIHLGDYLTEVEAACAYNKAAIKYFGEFAKLNEVTNETQSNGRISNTL